MVWIAEPLDRPFARPIEQPDTRVSSVENAELNALLTKMTLADTDAPVAVVFIDNRYWLCLPVGNGRVLGFDIGSAAILNADAQAATIRNLKELAAVHGIDNAGLTESGTFTTVNNAEFFGGRRRQSSDAGAYVELVTPDGVVDVGGFMPTSINAGMMLVTIDGDPTLATELPTAQQLVDGGTLSASALVANGGTLNPTDRILDLYSDGTAGIGTPYKWRYFAKNLTPGAHTIRVTRTGYANVSANNSFLYISGMFYRIGDETMPSADTFLIPLSNISAADSRWEFAFSVKPTGASAAEWMGHTNSERNRIAPVLTIDGTPAAWPASGMPLVGSSITVDVDTYLRHSELGTTDVASVTRRYTLNAAGLAHSFAYTWEVESVVTAAFPTMLPADNNFSRGSMVGASVDYTLLDDDNSVTAKFPSQAGYLWEGSGKWALAVYIPDLAQTMDNYDAPNTGMYIQDRLGDGTINKVYAQRNNNSVTIPAGTVWNAEYRYLAMYFPDGAEGALARV